MSFSISETQQMTFTWEDEEDWSEHLAINQGFSHYPIAVVSPSGPLTLNLPIEVHIVEVQVWWGAASYTPYWNTLDYAGQRETRWWTYTEGQIYSWEGDDDQLVFMGDCCAVSVRRVVVTYTLLDPPATETPSPTPTLTPTDTPTATQTPFVCQVNLISSTQFQAYQTNSPAQTRELEDMKVFTVDGNDTIIGLMTLTSPALNAKRAESSVEWSGPAYTVNARVEFPQGSSDKQIWYQVGAPGNTWIPVRYDGLDYSTTYDPCASVASPATLTFPYDRMSAANYAIEHSYDYSTNPGSLPANHVTRQLTDIPYADFYYSYLSSSPGSTGSAFYVSEAIWAGGLPMTVGDPQSCLIEPNPNSSEGWRYCRGVSGSSNPWDFHQQLLAYYTHAQVPGFNYPNTVLTGTNLGTQLDFTDCGTVQTDRISSGNPRAGDPPPPIPPSEQDLDPYFQAASDRSGIISDGAGLATFIQAALGCNGQIVEQGDYIYINPQDHLKLGLGDEEAIEDAHGLLVVGWGPIEDCSVAFTTRLTINDFSPTRDSSHPIPYVSDFTSAQPSLARPFYCTMAYDDGPTGSYFYRHDWFFFHLPDSITLTPSEIYVNPDWNW